MRELKRSPSIPPYDAETVKLVIEETNALFNEIRTTLQQCGKEARASSYISCGLMVNHTSMLRNKRILLAYLNERLERLKLLRWELGSALPEETRNNLSTEEVEFITEYDKLLTDYMLEVDVEGLTSDLQLPPKDLYIVVRVLKDCGKVMTSSGEVNLEANTTHYVQRKDVEMLIKQGMLEHIE